MESSGRVIAIQGDKVTLKMYKENSCSHCSGCGDSAKTSKELVVEIKEQVSMGDIVTFQLKDSKFLKIGFVVYILPIIMMVVGFNVGTKIGYTEKGSAAMSFLFLAGTFLVIHIVDKFLVKEKIKMEILKIEKGEEVVEKATCCH